MKATEDPELAGLRRANAALDAFAALAAHELQEPLRKLQMFADLLAPGAGASPQEAAESVERMRDAARRMARLVSDLLAYSRAESVPLSLEEVDLSAVAAEAAAEHAEPARREGGALELGALDRVRGDREQLKRLFGGLIANAVKFRRAGVPPRVSVRGAPGDAGRVVVEVADNGIGFEPQHAERIFEPFQRLHRRTDYEGSGLGLALCARIAARHGGTLRARSAPGEGSVFTVVLPRNGGA